MTAEPTDQESVSDTAGTTASRLTVVVAMVLVLVWLFVTFRDGGPTQAMARRMRDVDYFGRREAARKLGNAEVVDTRLAIPTLIAAKVDTDEEVRREAVNSLGLLGADAIRRGKVADRDRATEAILAALDDRAPLVREGALGGLALLFSTAEVMGRAGSNPIPPGERQRYVARVATLLEDSDPGVRAGAGSALSFLPGDLDPVLPALLKAVGVESSSQLSRPNRPANRGVGPAVALRRVKASKSSVPLLIEALGAPQPRVRILAASVLSRLGPEATDAIPPLLAMLAEPPPPDERDDVARAAAPALAAIAVDSAERSKVLEALRSARTPGDTLRSLTIGDAILALEQRTPVPRAVEEEAPRRR